MPRLAPVVLFASLVLALPAPSRAAPDEGKPPPAEGDEAAAAPAAPAGAGTKTAAEADGEAAELAAAPFSQAQRRFLAGWARRLRERIEVRVAKGKPPLFSLSWRAETYTKILYQNDQSQGSVTFGTPHPRGDNYAGNNGFASELSLFLTGHVSDRVDVGARIKSRFHRQWADFYENGDLAVDSSGLPAGANATGESLGMNHAAYIQLRGVYVRIRPPIPGVRAFHAGSSDLGMFNPWTVGRVRFIDRDNAAGLFLEGRLFGVDWVVSRISLPKLYASAGYTSGIDDPLVQNPFWTRDATYAVKLSQAPVPWLRWTAIGSYLLDEEADINDPDALGSTNFVDEKDGVVATLPRYQNANATLEVAVERERFRLDLLGGYSFSDPDLSLVFNTVDGNQGISPIPLATVHGYALRARLVLPDLGVAGLTVSAEYFNIGSDWVATFGARREADVLLTDGFLDGQLPTLNIANEFIDFRDPFYETIVGWHGATLLPRFERGPLALAAEFTFLEYNTDAQDRCTGADITDEHGVPIAAKVCPTDPITGRPRGVYPDFLFADGMTDTDFYSYANTNDRGRDPRAAYRQNQARRTLIGVLAGSYLFEAGPGFTVAAKLKYIHDRDLRDLDIEEDDYLGHLFFSRLSIASDLAEGFTAKLGGRLAYWAEDHRSGAVVGGKPDYPDYRTLKTALFMDLRYRVGGATLTFYLEWLNKDVAVSRGGVRDEKASFAFRNVVRGIGSIYAAF